MFTFGREHEKKCAVAYLRNPAQAALILQVVDAVHDLLDGVGSTESLVSAIRVAFVEGGTGVWEQAGSWLRKSSIEHAELGQLWIELARNPAATVRFRVACCLDEMPDSVAALVAPLLLADKSKKVVTMAQEHMKQPPAEEPGKTHLT